MRTTMPVAVVLALFLSLAFFAGSGFNALVKGDRGGAELREQVSDTADKTQGNDIQSQRGSDESGGIVGVILGTTDTVTDVVSLVLLLPLTLRDLGFPSWFATPIGTVLEIIMVLGVIQFVSGRTIR